MANSKRKCAFCGDRKLANSMHIHGSQAFCNKEHFIEYATSQSKRLIKKGDAIRRKESNKAHRERKKAVMTRSQWYSKYQALVNQLVRLRDEGNPCPTCGVNGENVSWDAGHFIPQKASDPRRFYMKNNHRQCVHCNQYGSGRRAEYRIWMIDKYGLEFVEWLECDANHLSLKEQFPHWSDIESAIVEARKELRSAGITPSV